MLVEQAMTAQPIVAFPKTTIRDALRLLLEADVRHLPIVEGKVLVGIVSSHDLRALLRGGLGYFNNPHEIKRIFERPVSQIMHTEPISVAEKAELKQAVDLMVEHRVGALPVVEPTSKKLVGILSYVDALRVVRAFL
jgi:acetoin utilization protein AcuB